MSRLAHHERNLLLKQSLLFITLSGILGLAFIFLILPLYIKILAARNLSSKIAFTDLDVPPSRPFLEQPFEATHSATIVLTGSAQADTKVILLHGGVPVSDQQVTGDGSFIFDSVTLDPGDNVFSAVTENKKGERSNPSSDMHIALITQAPKIEIIDPKDGLTITQRKQNPITIKGIASAGSKVFLNDQMLFVGSDGSFTGSLQLQAGDNKLTIKAVNQAQLETKKELTVKFAP